MVGLVQFTPTVPASSFFTSRNAREMSLVYTDEYSPYSVSLAFCSTSSSSVKLCNTTTGPKISRTLTGCDSGGCGVLESYAVAVWGAHIAVDSRLNKVAFFAEATSTEGRDETICLCVVKKFHDVLELEGIDLRPLRCIRVQRVAGFR